MPEQKPRLNVSVEGDVTIAEPIDKRILDEVSIRQLGEQLNALIAETDRPTLVLDFSAVSHMSSSALGMLITLHKRIRERNGRLRLCCIESAIYEVFVITRLNEIFQICQDRAEALESLA